MKADSIAREFAKKYKMPSFDIDDDYDHAEDEDAGSITNYLVTLGSDISTLTKGISPEVVDTMKLLVDFVLNNKRSSSSKDNANNSRQTTKDNEQSQELEIPGSAL